VCAVRVGLIGTGFGANVQLPGFKCVSDVEVIAITSGRAERAKAVAAEHGIPHSFDDYREMLRSVDLDLVSVVAPPYLHHEMTMAALDAGAHVLCEKPFAMHLAQALEMRDAADRLGRVHAVDHEFRYVPARTAIKRLLEAEEIGEVFLFRASDLALWPTDRPFEWWFDRARGGGVLGAIGSHYVDAVHWWIGPIARVSAELRALVPERRAEHGAGTERVTADDTATVAFGTEGGVTGRIDISMSAGGGPRRVEIYGTKGALFLEGTKLFRAAAGQVDEVITEDRDQGRLDDPRIGPFVELAQRVVDRINGADARPFPTFDDGVSVQSVLDAVHRSADEGREVEVAEIISLERRAPGSP
jgi:predicted dehydrogenase